MKYRVLLCAIATIAFLPAIASGQWPIGQNTPYTIYLNVDTPPVAGLDGMRLRDYAGNIINDATTAQSMVDTAARQALESVWINNSLCSDVFLISLDPAPPGAFTIDIVFTDDGSNPHTSFIASLDDFPGVQHINVEVMINTNNDLLEYTFGPGALTEVIAGVTPTPWLLSIRAVLTHELGHALGLQHVGDTSAVMYGPPYSGNTSPLYSERKTLYDLYHQDALKWCNLDIRYQYDAGTVYSGGYILFNSVDRYVHDTQLFYGSFSPPHLEAYDSRLYPYYGDPQNQKQYYYNYWKRDNSPTEIAAWDPNNPDYDILPSAEDTYYAFYERAYHITLSQGMTCTGEQCGLYSVVDGYNYE